MGDFEEGGKVQGHITLLPDCPASRGNSIRWIMVMFWDKIQGNTATVCARGLKHTVVIDDTT